MDGWMDGVQVFPLGVQRERVFEWKTQVWISWCTEQSDRLYHRIQTRRFSVSSLLLAIYRLLAFPRLEWLPFDWISCTRLCILKRRQTKKWETTKILFWCRWGVGGGDSRRVSQWVLSHDFVFYIFLCMFLGVGREWRASYYCWIQLNFFQSTCIIFAVNCYCYWSRAAIPLWLILECLPIYDKKKMIKLESCCDWYVCKSMCKLRPVLSVNMLLSCRLASGLDGNQTSSYRIWLYLWCWGAEWYVTKYRNKGNVNNNNNDSRTKNKLIN